MVNLRQNLNQNTTCSRKIYYLIHVEIWKCQILGWVPYLCSSR
jgi:hypothetical protein